MPPSTNRKKRATQSSERFGFRNKSGSGKDTRKRKSRQFESAVRPAPPVMFRGDLGGLSLPLRKESKKKTRRRIDLVLNVPGAEMRLPALPEFSFSIRWVSGLVVLALSFLLYQFWNSPSFLIEEVELIGLQRLSSRDVNTVLDLVDEPIFMLDISELGSKLMTAFPEFSQVLVEVGLPNSVRVTVEERVPILTWRQDGRTILVDAKGVAFPMRGENTSLPSLVVEASSSPPMTLEEQPSIGASAQIMTVEMVSAILSMSGQAPEGISLAYDAQHGLGWKDPNGWDVYFGEISNMGVKLNIYQAMLKKLDQEDIRPAMVSVEYVHSPYFRVEQ
ncbi:MAG: FtsQ-type POTRA domain-containing protein [Anaerolineales bacterium]|nr:MAG: FtsQ-type POTRA domain-containing protein [Anaerolineales bacterium]